MEGCHGRPCDGQTMASPFRRFHRLEPIACAIISYYSVMIEPAVAEFSVKAHDPNPAMQEWLYVIGLECALLSGSGYP